MTRALLVIALAACGRIGFDAEDAAPAPVSFCTTADVPATATAVACEDFDARGTTNLRDGEYLVPGRLYARGTAGFADIEVTGAPGGATAYHYQPAPSPVCTTGPPPCCYSDLFIDFPELVFTERAHLEYDHYLVSTPTNAWVGGMFWGGLNYPYNRASVTPALELGRWIHVAIDGTVGTAQPLTVTVDGVVRPNNAGTHDLGFGIQTAVGLYCWPTPGEGYIDNVLFWAR